MDLAEDFIQEMGKLFTGEELKEFINAISKDPIISIRLNDSVPHVKSIIEANSGFVLNDRVKWASNGYYLNDRPSFTLDPLFHAGLYYVQEASSMFLEQAIRRVTNDRPIKVLDLCAAPGGKSTHLCSLLPEGSIIVSNEIIRGRSNILAENMTKWGRTGVMVTCNTPNQIGESGLLVDLILVDAPCSGEGMFRKDDTAVLEWNMQNVSMCASRQREILEAIWPALKPGGHLIYSTCTYNRKEDEENVSWIIERFGANPVSIDVPDEWNITPAYHFYPHKNRGEGFFLSLFMKESELPKGQQIGRYSKSTRDVPAVCKEWIKNPDEYVFESDGNKVIAMPAGSASDMHDIAVCLYPLIKGIEVAEIKGHDVIPSHGLAMSRAINMDSFDQVEITKMQALSYLHGDVIRLDYPHKGFVLLTFAGIPIGFVKNIGNRANNLYPKEWRIRMNVN
jgi:16S rRNA (cytosine1407-C5)-methyltransferase